MTFGALEKQLFTWEDWDGDAGHKHFYNIELIKNLGEFQAGSKFDLAYWDDENSLLQISRDEKYYVFRIRVSFEHV